MKVLLDVTHKGVNKKDDEGRTIPNDWRAYCGIDYGGQEKTVWRWFSVTCVQCFRLREREKKNQWVPWYDK